MVVFDKTVTVRADARRVFDALRPGVGYAEGPAAPGMRFLHVLDALGVRWTAETVVDAVEPGRRLSFRQLAGDYARFRGRYEVDPAGDTTRVRMRLELDLPFVLPRLTTDEEIRRAWSARIDDALVGLKLRLETS